MIEEMGIFDSHRANEHASQPKKNKNGTKKIDR